MTGGLERGRMASRRPGFLAEEERGEDAPIDYQGDAHLLTITPTG